MHFSVLFLKYSIFFATNYQGCLLLHRVLEHLTSFYVINSVMILFIRLYLEWILFILCRYLLESSWQLLDIFKKFLYLTNYPSLYLSFYFHIYI